MSSVIHHRCLTCWKRLVPQTSVPRWLRSNDFDDSPFRVQLYNKRQAEIAEGRLGYMGESQFCSGQCAAFYGRAAATYYVDPTSSNMHGPVSNVLELWAWVKERREKYGKSK